MQRKCYYGLWGRILDRRKGFLKYINVVFISNKHAAFHFTIQHLESCELLMDYCVLCYKI